MSREDADLDDVLQRLRDPLTATERIDILRRVICYFHRPLTDADAISPSLLEGRPLPNPLRWWYSVGGKRTEVFSSFNRLLDPSQLTTGVDGKLIFYFENQGVYVWATEPNGEDPPVFGRFDETGTPWTDEKLKLSEFLVQACLFEGLLQAPYQGTGFVGDREGVELRSCVVATCAATAMALACVPDSFLDRQRNYCNCRPKWRH